MPVLAGSGILTVSGVSSMLAGIDIVDIERFKKTIERTPKILNRLFTEAELEYCRIRANPYPGLAVRFAAKEAVKKLDYRLLKGVGFRDIEILNDFSGKPYLVLHGNANQQHRNSGIGPIAISLSHSETQAIAMATARKGG